MPFNTDQLDIINAALAMIGDKPISGLVGETGDAVEAIEAIYPIRKMDALSSRRWRFAAHFDTLNRLGTNTTGEFSAVYALPPDCIILHAVKIGGENIAFDRFGQTVHCNAGINDSVVAEYGRNVTEELFTPRFRAAFMLDLASAFAASMGEDAAKSQLYEQQAQIAYAQAASLDAQNRTTSKVDAGAFIRARRSHWSRR